MKGKVIIVSLVLLISLIIGGFVFADTAGEGNQNEIEEYQAQVRTRECREERNINCENCDGEGELLRVQKHFNRSRKLEEGINGKKRQQMEQSRKHQLGQ